MLSLLESELTRRLLSEMIGIGANINKACFGKTHQDKPLDLAAWHGNIESMQDLLKEGAELTPEVLNHSIRFGYASQFAILIEAGADENARDCFSSAPG